MYIFCLYMVRSSSMCVDTAYTAQVVMYALKGDIHDPMAFAPWKAHQHSVVDNKLKQWPYMEICTYI